MMNILFLCLEYPQKEHGGIYEDFALKLGSSISKRRNNVYMITCTEGIKPYFENVNGVNVHRVDIDSISDLSFTELVMNFNFAEIEETLRIIKKSGKIDVLHAFGPLSSFSAKLLKCDFDIPLFTTFDTIEVQKFGELKTKDQNFVSKEEYKMISESKEISVLNKDTKKRIEEFFKVSGDKIDTFNYPKDNNDFENLADEMIKIYKR